MNFFKYAVFLPFFLLSSWAQSPEEQILQGVQEIYAPGVPGPLVVYGAKAFPLVVGRISNKLEAPVVAGGYVGKGRVLVFGHGGYLTPKSLKKADTNQLLKNAMAWAAKKEKVKIGIYQNLPLLNFLKQQGYSVETASFSHLQKFQLLILSPSNLNATQREHISVFVKNGGGLIVGGLGWGWGQLNPGKSLIYDFSGNLLLAPMGIMWADGYLEKTSKEGYKVRKAPSSLNQSRQALDLVLKHLKQEKPLNSQQVKQASSTLTRTIQTLPFEDKLFFPKLKEIFLNHKIVTIPSPASPIRKDQILDCLSLSYQIRESKTLAPQKIKAHPAAKFFPGDIPKGAKRVSKSLFIDPKIPDWHSTGLYAAPGETILIEIPNKALAQKIQIRIGSHTDSIWHHNQWKRAPELSRSFFLNQLKTEVANAFGGMIYIVVPKRCLLKSLTVKIHNAVEAPLFILGKTKLLEWREKIRYHPAPWAEIGSQKVIVTVPSTVVRKLEDPESLMHVWDQILDACADLAVRPRQRKRPERYVPDLQISVGYMHSGYPIMTLMDQENILANREALLKGRWGLFHEMGHNHQKADWTFQGTTEVTVNLFTLYVMEKVCQLPLGGHPQVSRESIAAHIKRYFNSADKGFESWKKRPFLALIMYIQMQQEFGWSAFQRVFSEYQKLKNSERPKTEQEKRDQWLIRFSKAVGKNLGPFFKTWDIPVSKQAITEIISLPLWMPANFPPKAKKE